MRRSLSRSNERTPLAHASHSHHKTRHSERHDRLPRRVQSIFFTMGAAVLLSWNVLITGIPYFLTRLQESAFENTFPSYLSVSHTWLIFLSLAKATASASNSSSSSASRIQHAIIVVTIMLLLLTISPILPIEDPTHFFFFVIVNSGIQATAGGYLQSAVVGVAALFGEQALQRYFTGQGAVGIVVSVVQYVSTAISLHRERQSKRIGVSSREDHSLTLFAFIFFGLATLYMVVSLIAHSTLVRSPLYRSVVLFKDQKSDLETVEETESVDDSDDAEDDQAFLSRSMQLHRRMSTSQLLKDDPIMTWKIAKMNVLYNTSVCFVYVVTLSVFPPITATILSVNPSQDSFFLSPVLFVSLHFLVFNIGDCIGRATAPPTHLPWWNQGPTDVKLLIASISRILFIPLFLMCNINGSSPLINSDIAYMVILLLFGISNGYLMNIGMMGASSVEHNYWLRSLIEGQVITGGSGNGTLEVDLAAKVAQFCLIGGLLLGSIMSFGVKSIICGGCNPFYG